MILAPISVTWRLSCRMTCCESLIWCSELWQVIDCPDRSRHVVCQRHWTGLNLCSSVLGSVWCPCPFHNFPSKIQVTVCPVATRHKNHSCDSGKTVFSMIETKFRYFFSEMFVWWPWIQCQSCSFLWWWGEPHWGVSCSQLYFDKRMASYFFLCSALRRYMKMMTARSKQKFFIPRTSGFKGSTRIFSYQFDQYINYNTKLYH
jgi:hypothetical protein